MSKPSLIDRLLDQYCHVEMISRFVDRETRAILTASQVNARHAWETQHLHGAKAVAERLLKHKALLRVTRVTHRPDDVELVAEGDQIAVNLYRPSTLKPTHGDVTVFSDHVKYLMPDPEDREHFLDYLAHLAQHPGVKINHTILFKGKPGIGKDLALNPTRAITGAHNLATITTQDLETLYNDWADCKTLVIVQELKEIGKRFLENKLKPLLTDPPSTIRVHKKFVPAYEIPNVLNFIMLTNAEEPLAISPDDRRFFVCHSPATPQSPTYYRELVAWCDAHASDVYGDLLDRDLSNFNAKGHAPATTAKDDLIAASRPRLYQHLKAAIDEHRAPFRGDLVTVPEVVRSLTNGLQNSSTEHIIGRTLRDLGAVKLGQIRLDNGDRPYLWAVRKPELYSQMTPNAIAQAYAKQSRVVNLGAGR